MKGGVFSVLSALMVTICVSTAVRAADTPCPYAIVDVIQVQSNAVLIRLAGQGWKKLGSPADPATQLRQSVALTAQSTGRPIQFVFTDLPTTVCAQNNYGLIPTKVRIAAP